MGDAEVTKGVALQSICILLATSRLIGEGQGCWIGLRRRLEDLRASEQAVSTMLPLCSTLTRTHLVDELGDIVRWLQWKSEIAIFAANSHELRVGDERRSVSIELE